MRTLLRSLFVDAFRKLLAQGKFSINEYGGCEYMQVSTGNCCVVGLMVRDRMDHKTLKQAEGGIETLLGTWDRDNMLDMYGPRSVDANLALRAELVMIADELLPAGYDKRVFSQLLDEAQALHDTAANFYTSGQNMLECLMREAETRGYQIEYWQGILKEAAQ